MATRKKNTASRKREVVGGEDDTHRMGTTPGRNQTQLTRVSQFTVTGCTLSQSVSVLPPTLTLPTIQTITSHDGVPLHAQTWQLTGRPARAAVVIVHGVGEHCDRYQHVIDRLIPLGIDVYSWDHRGHGRSGGRRGHVNRWTDYTTDLRAVLARARAQHAPDLPLFVFGHSMGALITLAAALESPPLAISGLIISGVPIQPAGVAKPHLIFLSHILSRIWPTFSVGLPFDGAALTSDTDELGKLQQDTTGHRRITVRWGKEALDSIQRIRANTAQLTHPLLILHGALDTVNLPSGAEWLHQHAASADKELHLYPATHHEPHNDVERNAMLDHLSHWLQRQIASFSPSPSSQS